MFLLLLSTLAGAGLSRCAVADEQCCTQDYITSVQNAVVAALRRGLAEEFGDIIDEYDDDLDNLFECKEKLLDLISQGLYHGWGLWEGSGFSCPV